MLEEDAAVSNSSRPQSGSSTPRIPAKYIVSGYGTPRTTEEDLVKHGESRCQEGATVKVATEFENNPEWPWLKSYAGKEGILVKPVAQGWGWVARFGNTEGTFRTRDGYYMLAYLKPGRGPNKRAEIQESSQQRIQMDTFSVPGQDTFVKEDLSTLTPRSALKIRAPQTAIRPNSAGPKPLQPSVSTRYNEKQKADIRRGLPAKKAVQNPFALTPTNPEPSIARLMQTRKVDYVASLNGETAYSRSMSKDLLQSMPGGIREEDSFSTTLLRALRHGARTKGSRPSTAQSARSPGAHRVRIAGSQRPWSAPNRSFVNEGMHVGWGSLHSGPSSQHSILPLPPKSPMRPEIQVVDGEPGCYPGAKVRLSRSMNWPGLERFRGHVGELKKHERGVGWSVFFPDLREESFFFTSQLSGERSMLVFAYDKKEDIPTAHIYANQLRVILEQEEKRAQPSPNIREGGNERDHARIITWFHEHQG